MSLLKFYVACEEFESWMEDKENILNTFSSNTHDIDIVQAKYEVGVYIAKLHRNYM